MKNLSLVVAMDRNGAIGKTGALPWYLPADLKHFRALTIGHPIIMGRKTFESIGQALPGRVNIVVTRNHEPGLFPGAISAHSVEAAIALAKDAPREQEIFIIGGGEIFKQFMPIVDKLYVTEVDTEVSGADVFFPEIDASIWEETSRETHYADNRNRFNCDFMTYERR